MSTPLHAASDGMPPRIPIAHHIDVRTVLHGAVCDLYSNLVTRPTGAAVRTAIERLVTQGGPPTLATLDFSRVQLLDFSCADEIIAKLLLRYVQFETAGPEWEGFVTVRGIREDHLDAVEAVLERHALALVWERHDGPTLLGAVDEDERRHWDVVRAHGPLAAPDASRLLATAEADTARLFGRLWSRRLLMRTEGLRYRVPGAWVYGTAA